MITEKKPATADDLPEPIDIDIDVPPEEDEKGKKPKEKKAVKSPQKKDSLEELIEKNIKWSKAIYSQNKKIKNRLNMMIWASYLKIIFILLPIIVAIIYLPPLLGEYMEQFKSVTGDKTNFINMILEGYGLENITNNSPSK